MPKKIEPLVFYPGGNPGRLVAEVRVQEKWRPTAVALVRVGANGPFLVTESLKPLKPNRLEKRSSKRRVVGNMELVPDLIKGGIESTETPHEALLRELLEEGTIKPEGIKYTHYLGFAYVPFSQNSVGRDGYSDGKLHLMYLVVLKKGATYAPGTEHGVHSVHKRKKFWDFFREDRGKRNKYYVLYSQAKLHAEIRKATR